MKMIRALALSLLVCAIALAQNTALMPVAKQQFFDQYGKPLAGGYIYTCVAGSTCAITTVGQPPSNPLATYTDSTGGTQNPNPVVLDSAGRASIWIGTLPYKIVATNYAGEQQWTVDNIQTQVGGSGQFAQLTVTGNQTVGGTLGVTGAAAFASSVTSQSTNGVLNVSQFSGSDLGQKITAALAACPSTGCSIEVPVGSSGNVSGPINVTKPYVHIACDGNFSVVLTQTFHGTSPATGSMFYVNAANGFAITGCYLDANQQNDPYTASNSDNGLVYLVGTNFAHVTHNYFHDGGTNDVAATQNGVRVVGGAVCGTPSITCMNGYITGSYNEIDDNIFDTIPWMAMGGGFDAGYNDFHDNYEYSCGEPFDFNGNNVDSPNMRFHHNTVYNFGTQAFLESVSGAQVDNNYFYLNKNTGAIWVHTAVTTIQQRSRITDNVFIGTSTALGPGLWIFANTEDIEVSNNQFYGWGGHAIEVSGAGGTAQRTTIRGNEISNVGTAGSGYCGVHLANGGTTNPIVDVWITGNELTAPSGGYGICSDSTAPVHAVIIGNTATINFPSGCSGCVIANNEQSAGQSNTQAPSTFSSTIAASGAVTGQHFGGSAGTPTAACGAAAGSCTGVSVSGNDFSGTFTFTTGTTAPSSGVSFFGITFASAYSVNVHCAVTPGNAFAATDFSSLYVTGATTGFGLNSTGGALISNQAHSYNYVCGY